MAHGAQSDVARAILEPGARVGAFQILRFLASGAMGDVYLRCWHRRPRRWRSARQSSPLWDLGTGAPRGELAGHRLAVWSMSFSPDGRRLVSGSSDGDLYLWDVATGARKLLAQNESSVIAARFFPDGNKLAWTTQEGWIHVEDLSGGAGDHSPASTMVAQRQQGGGGGQSITINISGAIGDHREIAAKIHNELSALQMARRVRLPSQRGSARPGDD